MEFFKGYGVCVFHSLKIKIKGKKDYKKYYNNYVPNTMYLSGKRSTSFCTIGKIKYYSLAI